jgi:hypothetical protein
MRTVSGGWLVAGLVLLAGGNLALDVGALWFLEEVVRSSEPYHQIPLGLILGQLMLTALWLGLGDGRWYVRLVPAVATSLGLGMAIGLAGRLSSRARNYEPDPSAMIAFIFLAMMLAAACLAFVVRRTAGWRLTRGQTASVPVGRQFQVGDALLWMVFVGGSLGAIRFLMTIDETFVEQSRDIALYSVLAVIVAFSSSVMAFSNRWRERAVLAGVVVLTGALVAVPDAYDYVQRMRATATLPVPFYRYVETVWNQIKNYEVCAISIAVCVVVNCRLLGRMGWKLVRRGGAGVERS